MLLAVKKRGDRWLVEFMFRGERVYKRLPEGRTKADAQALESKLRHQIFDAVDLGKLPDPLLEKLIDEWLAGCRGKKAWSETANHASIAVGAMDRYKSGLRLSDVLLGAEAIKRFGAGSGHAAATVNRRLCILKAVAKYAFQKGYTKENYSAKIQLLPEKGYTPRDVTPEKVQAVLDAAPTARARALIAFGAYTGMRLGEILKLTPEDVVGGFIRVRDTKTSEDRQIPIPGPLKPHLGMLPFDANWRNVYRGWEQARKRAGVEMRFHDLRHAAATAMAGKADPLFIMAVLGHKSYQTTRKYVHPSLKDKAGAMKAITAGLQQARRKKARG